MRIDFHTHLPPAECGLALPALSAAALRRRCEAQGAQCAVVQGWPFAEEALCVRQNELLSAALEQQPDYFLGFCAVSPVSGQAALDEAERRLKEGFVGVGELDPVRQRFSLRDPDFRALCGLCQRQGAWMCLTLPMTLGPDAAQEPLPGELLPLVEAFPALKLILSNFGGGLPFYGLMGEVGRALERVWFDNVRTPALLLPQAEESTRLCLGRNRLLWGSHLPGPRCNSGPCPEAPADWRGF